MTNCQLLKPFNDTHVSHIEEIQKRTLDEHKFEKGKDYTQNELTLFQQKVNLAIEKDETLKAWFDKTTDIKGLVVEDSKTVKTNATEDTDFDLAYSLLEVGLLK